ncbi:MAG TPA: HemK/PrmC family methyltransferase [Terriglobales bacterium]|nr:HemK/PrmC family methyltransferase [Terriglobales bacterium]
MQLRSTLDSAIERLTAAGTGSPRLNGEVLLMFTLGCDRAYLYAHAERELSADEHARYQSALEERARGKPSQYITGHQEFWGLDFLVSPAVLIPRPETEHVIETVLELARSLPRPPRIVDVGTGSGCIALALAKELPGAEIIAVDISAPALEIARANAARLQLDQRVTFLESNLLGALPAPSSLSAPFSISAPLGGKATRFEGPGPLAQPAQFDADSFDFVVSNPPYVGEAAPEKVQREVRDFEPRVAVFAGESGMEVYRQLIPQARERLEPGGWLVIEIGFSMEAAVRDLLAGWQEVRVTHDLQGIPRVVAARFASLAMSS